MASRADYNRGCRTPECRQAHAVYRAKWRARRVPPFVAAGRAREHLHLLFDAGLSLRAIARRAGVSDATVRRILGTCCGGPTRRVRADTESRILAVRPHTITLEESRHPDPEPWWLDLAPLPADIDLTWRADGKCLDPDIPTRMFFPGRGDLETLRSAQAICGACSVREPCLSFALLTDAEGIWGGTTRQQRERMLGRRGGLPAPQAADEVAS